MSIAELGGLRSGTVFYRTLSHPVVKGCAGCETRRPFATESQRHREGMHGGFDAGGLQRRPRFGPEMPGSNENAIRESRLIPAFLAWSRRFAAPLRTPRCLLSRTLSRVSLFFGFVSFVSS